jgi:hypothetical protein
MILISAGFVLFLLPFNLAGSAADSWRTASIIVMLVIGVLCLIAFALYERFLAPKSFIPFEYLLNRTILGACILAATLDISF